MIGNATTSSRAAAAVALTTAALVVSIAPAGCAHTINYLDPAGPRYEAALAPPADPAACADSARPFTAVTFNIEHARQLDRALDVLRSQDGVKDADVLLLQEMNPEGVERIAAALSMNYLFFPSGVHPQSKQDFGTAVLSRWPLEGGRKIVLPHAAFITNLKRAVTQATVRCGTRRVVVMTLHLPAPLGLSHDDRQRQVETIIESARSINDPLIIAGDFNARWVGSIFEKTGFTWLTKDQPGTTAVLWMRKKFDHVFARGFAPAPGGASAGVSDANGSSDHHPMWVKLRFVS
jgi:endonuclease/exonuclease/phosphatase family metal-dependent hydrolase